MCLYNFLYKYCLNRYCGVVLLSRVALIGENSIGYIRKLIEIWNHGDCAVLLDWNVPVLTMIKMMRQANVQECYIEKGLFESFRCVKTYDIHFIVFDRECNSALVLPVGLYDSFCNNYTNEEAVIIYSSGTTGKSRGIILSHFAINTNADAISEYMNLSNEDCLYLAKPLTHSSTITGELLVALKKHIRIVVAPTIVPPRVILNNIFIFKVTTMGLNPLLIKLMSKELANKPYNISSLKTIYVSGSIFSKQLREFCQKIFLYQRIYNVYGLSEAGPRVAAQREGCCTQNSVGRAISGVEIVVVDNYGHVVKNGQQGIIHVKTPSKYSGYIWGPPKNISLYKDWLNTGDIGFFDEHQELHIVGRADEMAFVGSHKIYTEDIVDRILEFSNVEECVVTTVRIQNKEVLCCLYVASSVICDDIRNKLGTVLMKYEIPKAFIRVDSIPTTNNGKISLYQVKKKIIKALKRGELHGERIDP